MFKFCIAIVVFALSTNNLAQAPRINPEAPQSTADAQLANMAALFEQRPDVQGLLQSAGMLSTLSKTGDAQKAEARQLVQDAAALQKAGRGGEARRKLSQAFALLLGKAWDNPQEFGASLALRTDLMVADLNAPFLMSLTQSYPAPFIPKNPLKLKLSIVEASPRSAVDVVIASGKAPQLLATFDIANRDLIDEPLRLRLDLSKVSGGAYLLIAEMLDGEIALAKLATPVNLAANIAARERAIASKAARIVVSGPSVASTLASIRYPFELARALNTRSVEITSYDFAGQIKRSEELVKALAQRKNLLWRAKGDARRNYVIKETQEIIPYRVYVPATWGGKKKLPMIIALHGGSLDENNMLDRGDGIMGKLAEQYGFIVASPLGYRVSGGYGTSAYGTWGGNNALANPTAAQLRLWDLSEKDVLNVMELVASEYGVDRSRIYMMGNSMGAGGTWYLASKYGEKLAGLAPCASSMNIKVLSFEKFNGMPLLACVGDLDSDTRKEVQKYGVARVKEISANAEYLPVANGTHGTGVQIAMPQIFEFFSRHTKQSPR